MEPVGSTGCFCPNHGFIAEIVGQHWRGRMGCETCGSTCEKVYYSAGFPPPPWKLMCEDDRFFGPLVWKPETFEPVAREGGTEG